MHMMGHDMGMEQMQLLSQVSTGGDIQWKQVEWLAGVCADLLWLARAWGSGSPLDWLRG